MSNSFRPHGLQHTRPPCPSPTPGVYSNARPLSRWCHPIISSSVVPFSSHLRSFPASGSFPRVSSPHQVAKVFSTSVLPMNIQDWFPLGWTGWISLQSLPSLWFLQQSLSAQNTSAPTYFRPVISIPSTHSRKLDWNFSEIICILSQLIVTRDNGETKGLKWHRPPKDLPSQGGPLRDTPLSGPF